MDFAVTGEAGTEADLDRLTPISLRRTPFPGFSADAGKSSA